MAKTIEGGTHSNIAPFLMKCYEMVEDESTDTIISWSPSNDSFVIRNITDFSTLLLPKYFKHQNFSSFMRQLNIYGFRKVDTDRWEFANEAFVKGQKHLLSNIKRRKHPQPTTPKNPQQENQTSVVNEVDYSSLQREVEILKIDRSTLTQELVKLQQHQESSEKKMLLLGERLEGMENSQQQLLSFLVMVMKNPRLLVQLLHPNKKESNWPSSGSAKITLDKDSECDDNIVSDGMIVRYQHMIEDKDDDVAPSGSGSEHEISFDNVKDFFKNFEIPSCPIDESFLSNEIPGSITVPELDLALLEKFLLSSPGRDDPRLDEESADAETEMDASPKFSLLWKEGLKEFPSLEILTEELAFLSPGEKQ